MHKLVKAEIYKLFKNKTFKVLCVISIGLSLLMMFMSSPLMEEVMMDSLGDMSIEQKEALVSQMSEMNSEEQVVNAGQLGFNLTAKDPMNPTALEIYHSSFGSGAVEILIGVLIAALMAKEYTQGTIKNTLAYGKKRHEFYIAKFLATVIGITVMLACLTLVSTVGSIIMNGWGQTFEITQLVGMISSFLAAIVANSAVAALIMIIAIAVKSNGATIGITAGVFILVPTISGFFYGTYSWFDKIYELTPFYNSALATSIYSTNTDLIRAICVALITIIISLVIGIQMFKVQDIK